MRKKRQRCSIQQETIDGIVFIRVRGRLVDQEVSQIFEKISEGKVVLDLNRIEEIKTKDLKLLYRLSKEEGKTVSVFAENKDVAEMIVMSGLEKQLLFCKAEDDAIAQLSKVGGA